MRKIFGQQSTRSGSGRIVQDNFVLSTEIYGGGGHQLLHPFPLALMEILWIQKSAPKYITEGAKICTIKLYIRFNLSIHNVNLQVPFFSYCKIWFAVIIHDDVYLREP